MMNVTMETAKLYTLVLKTDDVNDRTHIIGSCPSNYTIDDFLNIVGVDKAHVISSTVSKLMPLELANTLVKVGNGEIIGW